MLFRAAASKLTLALTILATAVESNELNAAGLKGGSTTPARKMEGETKILSCDEYNEHHMNMQLAYVNNLIESFDLEAVQESTCNDINRQVVLPSIYNDAQTYFAENLPAEYAECAADNFMLAMDVIATNAGSSGMDTSGVLAWTRPSCEDAIDELYSYFGRRDLAEAMNRGPRELFVFTLAAAVAVGAIAASTATVAVGTVTVVCTFENCMGCDSRPGWYDSDGSAYNCNWYDVGDRCLRNGSRYANFGYTANQACCSCGGGL